MNAISRLSCLHASGSPRNVGRLLSVRSRAPPSLARSVGRAGGDSGWSRAPQGVEPGNLGWSRLLGWSPAPPQNAAPPQNSARLLGSGARGGRRPRRAAGRRCFFCWWVDVWVGGGGRRACREGARCTTCCHTNAIIRQSREHACSEHACIHGNRI